MSPTERAALWQFNLRSLFALVSAMAICALVASKCGYLEATGTGVSLLLLGASLKMPRFRGSILVRGGLLALAIGILWFAAVDWYYSIIECKHCHLSRDQVEHRVFHWPVRSWSRNRNELICQISGDLGVPCRHEFEHWPRIRMWGLVYCCCPCISGTTGLAGPKWYDDKVRERVRRFAERNPDRGREFQEEVLVKQNFAYLKSFVAEIRAMEDP